MKTILSLTFSLLLFSCHATKFVKKPPFKIIDAKYQNWYGGREGVRGISVKILVQEIPEDLTFKNIYFKGKKLKVFVSDVENLKLLSANINTGYRPETLNMHVNPKKEYGNTLPQDKKDFPFALKENEAVISYLKSNKEYFYKVILKKEKDLMMP